MKTQKQTQAIKRKYLRTGLCRCGHLGGATASMLDVQQHATHFDHGHGACYECSCPQFTWTGWAEDSLIDSTSKAKRRII